MDNSTGVLILGGHTGALTNSGSISVTESYTATDTNGDGVLDGPYAKGTGRYGVRVTGSSPFIGTLNNGAGGSITVNGNNSFGVSVEAPLQGDLLNQGVITVTGDNTVALRETSGVTGKVQLLGGVTASGGSAAGVDIGGKRRRRPEHLQHGPSRPASAPSPAAPIPPSNALLLPEDLLQAKSAVTVEANVAGGIFIGAAPASTVSTDTTTDADHDGIVDSLETAGAIATYGAAPAMLIGAAGRDVHLGAFGSGANAYGLIIEGSISGNGVFDNNAGNALQIGVTGGTVHIDGGVSVIGSVTSQGYEADSTAIHFGAGAVAPTLSVAGSVTASATTAKASSVTAVLIDAGGSLTSLTNSGTIGAAVTGDLASAYAVVDKSGSLSPHRQHQHHNHQPDPRGGQRHHRRQDGGPRPQRQHLWRDPDPEPESEQHRRHADHPP